MSETFRQKKLRACIHCRRVQYEKDFTTSGCANCGTRHCTPNFHG
jgi:RNA polymerase subunit RPABC4/transcription elongation factor Spt4